MMRENLARAMDSMSCMLKAPVPTRADLVDPVVDDMMAFVANASNADEMELEMFHMVLTAALTSTIDGMYCTFEDVSSPDEDFEVRVLKRWSADCDCESCEECKERYGTTC